MRWQARDGQHLGRDAAVGRAAIASNPVGVEVLVDGVLLPSAVYAGPTAAC
jgi:hypothetical protein